MQSGIRPVDLFLFTDLKVKNLVYMKLTNPYAPFPYPSPVYPPPPHLHTHLLTPEDEAGQHLSAAGRLSGALAGHSAAVQAAAAQAAMAAQVAALEQLRDKLEAGEPPEKKMAMSAEEHQRLLQRALQHNLLAMTAQMPMNIRINNQGG